MAGSVGVAGPAAPGGVACALGPGGSALELDVPVPGRFDVAVVETGTSGEAAFAAALFVDSARVPAAPFVSPLRASPSPLQPVLSHRLANTKPVALIIALLTMHSPALFSRSQRTTETLPGASRTQQRSDPIFYGYMN